MSCKNDFPTCLGLDATPNAGSSDKNSAENPGTLWYVNFGRLRMERFLLTFNVLEEEICRSCPCSFSIWFLFSWNVGKYFWIEEWNVTY